MAPSSPTAAARLRSTCRFRLPIRFSTFPGNTTASQIPASANDQNLTSGLRNALGAPTLATVTGILTDPNFRAAIQALSQRQGTESLAEPEVVTISGRQTQMRATQIINVITGFNFQQGTAATTTTGTGVLHNLLQRGKNESSQIK